MNKHLPALFITFFCLAAPAAAATIRISEFPSVIDSEPFSVDVEVSGAASGKPNYLRVDLFKEGSSKYFGETYVGDTWNNGSSGSAYFKVDINSEGSASASLVARVGDPDESEYSGPGPYKLRVRRYTASGNSSSDSITPVDVEITINRSPTPTLVPTLIPTTTPTVVPPTSIPDNTPTIKPTKIPLPTATPKPEKIQTPYPTNYKVATPTPCKPPPLYPHYPFCVDRNVGFCRLVFHTKIFDFFRLAILKIPPCMKH